MARIKVGTFILCTLIFQVTAVYSQGPSLRTGAFLHHSVGANIWGPNGSTTSVPEQISHYNAIHGYTGDQAVNLNQLWFPVYNDNEWSTYHTIFEIAYPEGICMVCNANPIIIIKSGALSSSIASIGQSMDTLNPTYKTIFNYKWHWRHIIKVMESHPEHFFVIWTNAPLVYDQTNPTSAFLSKWFSKWANDTLAAGLDPVYGAFPPNIHVFDYFHKVSNAEGYLSPLYAVSPFESLPNAAATEFIAPQLVTETFDNALTYETSLQVRNITGKLIYLNSDSTPMANVKLYLQLACCTIVDSAVTNSEGNFMFTNRPPSNYTIVPVINYAWGGVNSDDALAILKHYVGMASLTGLYKIAANLDLNHTINATDALLAAKRFVHLIDSFPVGNWVWDNTQLILTGENDIHVTIKTLCTGDVNGSHTL